MRTQLLLYVCALIASPMVLADNADQFVNADSYTGTIKVAADNAGTATQGLIKYAWDIHVSASSNLHFVRSSAGVLTSGLDGGSATVVYKLALTVNGCTTTRETKATSNLSVDSQGNARYLMLGVSPKEYAFELSNPFVIATDTVSGSGGAGCAPAGTTQTPVSWWPAMGVHHIPLPDSGLILKGSQTSLGPLPVNVPVSGDTRPMLAYEVSWELTSSGSDLEVVIDPENYETWRPQAGKDEKTEGNQIAVLARLQHKNGIPVQAKKFIFELTGVSRIPGVANNYPLQGENDLDLQMNDARNPSLKVLVQPGQKSETTKPQPREATAVVTSYDWGGYAWINVSAELEDGQIIVGHLKGSDLQRISLPKRVDSGGIATSWLKANGYAAEADNSLDDDEEPIGDGHKGDGYTLYEEYRGFIEKSKHIEGDPRRKDLFIRDEVGDSTLVGLSAFKAESRLAVHEKLLDDEFAKDRVMNFNHGRWHLVDQHGVRIVINADATMPIAWSGSYQINGTPRYTDEVRLPASIDSLASPATIRGALDYKDKAVAHELFHTVNVWHHGEKDYRSLWVVIFPGNAAYPGLAEPRVRNTETNQWIDVNAEDGPGDLAHVIYEAAKLAVEQFRRYCTEGIKEACSLPFIEMLENQRDQKGMFADGFPVNVYIGEKGGQHSGYEQCVMRYEFAAAYERTKGLTGAPGTAFSVFSKNVAGDQICDTPNGTGTNAADRVPESRHGDAAPNRGDCRHQICVNDAINHPAR